jgi:hypothetical protein
MTRSRQEQIHLDSTPFYHCYVRCVRRAFLCGTDHFSGQNFDHRKQWLVSRLRFLSYVYAIDICAYAIMSNHYHVVLHVDKKRADNWTHEEIAQRWAQLYSAPLLATNETPTLKLLVNSRLTRVLVMTGGYGVAVDVLVVVRINPKKRKPHNRA